MPNRQCVLLLFLIITFCGLQAQSPAVTATFENARQIWSADVDFRFNTLVINNLEQRLQRVLYRSPASRQDKMLDIEALSMGGMIYEALIAERLTAYLDENYTQRLTSEELLKLTSNLDTIYIVDPTSYETETRIVGHYTDPADCNEISLTIRLSYWTDGSIRQEIIAAALVMLYEVKPVYFKFKQLDKAIDLEKSRWNVVNRNLINLPLEQLDLLGQGKLKTTDIAQHLADHLMRANKSGFVTPLTYEPITPARVDLIQGQRDTIAQVNPETYEMQWIITEQKGLVEAMTHLRLYQFWAWDAENAELTISPIGYSPAGAKYGQDGNLQLILPLMNFIYPPYRQEEN